jgi:hypothetical protein
MIWAWLVETSIIMYLLTIGNISEDKSFRQHRCNNSKPTIKQYFRKKWFKLNPSQQKHSVLQLNQVGYTVTTAVTGTV